MAKSKLDNFGNKRHKLTDEDASKGGRNGSKTRAAKKDLKACLQALLETNIRTTDGREITGMEAMAVKAFQEAAKGDWKAWELVRDTSGQKPVDKVVVSEVEQSVIDEVEAMVNDTE